MRVYSCRVLLGVEPAPDPLPGCRSKPLVVHQTTNLLRMLNSLHLERVTSLRLQVVVALVVRELVSVLVHALLILVRHHVR